MCFFKTGGDINEIMLCDWKVVAVMHLDERTALIIEFLLGH